MDATPSRRVAASLLTVLCPTVGCLGVGVLTAGTQVFALPSGFFQLGVNAVIVGVLVLLARRGSVRRFLAWALLLASAMTAMTVGAGPRILLHTAILMVLWIVVVFLHVRILSRVRWTRGPGRYLAWFLLPAAGLSAAGMVFMALFRPAETMPHLLFYARLAVLTGLGLASGFLLEDRLQALLRPAGARA